MQIREIAESDLNFLIASLMEILKLISPQSNDLVFCHLMQVKVMLNLYLSDAEV